MGMLRQLVKQCLYALLAIPTAFQILIILWAIWGRTAHVPYWDEWDAAVLLQHAMQGRLQLGELWAPHAGLHRIVVPRLVDLTIIILTGWNRQIEMTVDLLVAVLTGLLLFSVARHTVQTSAGLLAASAVGSLLLFSFTQYANWFAPFQLAFIATVFGAVLCMATLSRPHLGWRAFGLAGAGALIASLSSFPGLMV